MTCSIMMTVISMKKIELLAPAGSFEALEAAVMCGADAVYLGGTKFGARAFASNFDNDAMVKAVKYAHLYGVKIYVTVNTLVYDEEVASFLEYISFLNETGVDAFIIQDIGMLHLLRTTYPNLELHASTQMHIHNLDALNKLKQLGVKRAVLPREFSLLKIEQLKKDSGMEIEIFVHGALCVSYSGQCLMSYLIGGRSGNRGECAGSCRLPYELIEEDNGVENKVSTNGNYLLSTRDLYTLDNIGKIISTGVDSLKIEGRMKRPEYVALVTSLYRKAIDNYYDGCEYQVTEKDVQDLKKMFNRGFTGGYLFGDKNASLMNAIRPNHMGTPLGEIVSIDNNFVNVKLSDYLSIGDGIRVTAKEDIGFTVNEFYKDGVLIKEAYRGDIVSFDKFEGINVGDSVLKTTDVKLMESINKMFQNNNRKIKISGVLEAHIDEYMHLSVTDGEFTINVASDVKVLHALKQPVSQDIILEKLNKIGDTPYIFESIDIKIDQNIFIPLTAINALKREALEKMSKLRSERKNNISHNEYKLEMSNYLQDEIKIKAKVKTMEHYQACSDNNIDVIYVEDLNLYEKIKHDNKVMLSLPRVLKNNKYIDSVMVGELGSIADGVVTDFSLNVVNSYAVAFLHHMGAKTVTLSYEMDDNKIDKLIRSYAKRYSTLPNLEVIVYGRIEAMITEYCPLNTHLNNSEKNCSHCKNGKKYYLEDRFNNKYVLTFENCITNIYDYKKLDIINKIDKFKNINIRNFRANFVDENYDECSKIINSIKNIY